MAAEDRVMILDGAIGTELSKKNIDASKQWAGWPAQLFAQDVLEEVHRSYIDAGADIITANTYGNNAHVMGSPDLVDEANRMGIEIARRAASRAERGREIIVAGSMSNHPPLVKNTREKVEESTSLGSWPSPQVELQNYRDQLASLEKAKPDWILLEMIIETVHGDLLIAAATETDLPVVVGLTAAENGHSILR